MKSVLQNHKNLNINYLNKKCFSYFLFLFREIQFFPRAKFGQGVGKSLFSYLSCSGNEQNIGSCGYRKSTCSHSQDVGISCVSKYNPIFAFIGLKVYLLKKNPVDHTICFPQKVKRIVVRSFKANVGIINFILMKLVDYEKVFFYKV